MVGENVDLTGWTEANKNLWMLQVEGFLSSFVKFDIVTNCDSLDSVSKTIFSEYAARYCAIPGISYNMEGYTSRVEAEDMINTHAFRMTKIEEQLSDSRVLKRIGIQ